jgi:cytochrome c biogenesis protein CcdA
MTSLTDVYEHGVGAVASRRRRVAGLSLFGLGAAMVVTGIVLATTSVGDQFGLGRYGARELAGVLAGLGVPAAFLGSFTLLPADERTRAAALIGGALSVFGVVLFREAYPYQWVGATGSTDLTLPVVVVYLLGTVTTFWCLFLAVANVKRRNDPGGTVTMEVTEAGTTRVLEVSGSVPGMGGVGLFGTDPEGEVETQTNEDVLYSRSDQPGQPTSDGGAATQSADAATPVEPVPDEVVEAVNTRGQPDQYCGNCEHFQYVRVDGEIQPGCGYHEQVMSDMDACDDWSANN